MNGLEFVTRKTEKTGNSNDVVGREGKKVEQLKGTFLPQGKLVGFMLFSGNGLLSANALKSVMKQLFVSLVRTGKVNREEVVCLKLFKVFATILSSKNLSFFFLGIANN